MTQPSAPRQTLSLAPEHDWPAASRLIRPVLRPAGTPGIDGHAVSVPRSGALPSRPLITDGPAGLAVAYAIPGSGFYVFAGADHLLSWAVGPEDVHAAAMANLSAWSVGAAWESETSGARTMIWSATGDGLDAARILLPEVRAHLSERLGGAVLVGLPERDLLLAVARDDADGEIEALFGAYVAERWAEADDPIDEHVFELVDGELVPRPTAAE